ncbi:protein of unknown function [Chitinophaga sp. YR573]|uniref:DUF4373 domain-containing protein n=1 Tax=Chitinophaga sp. YR573 TaxID=1881040 RepID=UPI0008CCAA0E|nr:DUF4373 domain-containing protein [Chitinophaga sp. YR573]SEV88599.1 protein of unknown function [Chitinophaga sp. YR573]
MARPAKQGLDYFPMDVDLDQDDKLGMIIGEYGEKGEKLFTKLLCWIYKHNGYFTEWDESVQLRFLRRYDYCGFSMSFIKELVPKFIRWGLLDQTVFNTFQILTSTRIQKTWLDASRKRKDRIIDSKIWILEVNDGLKAEETTKQAEVIDKVNESRVKEIKEEKIVVPEAVPLPPPSKDSLEEKQQKMLVRQKQFYDSIALFVKQYSKEMLRAFYTHWSEPNRSKTKMKCEMEDTWDLSLRLIKWEKNEQRFSKGKINQNEPGQITEEQLQAKRAIEDRTRRIANNES